MGVGLSRQRSSMCLRPRDWTQEPPRLEMDLMPFAGPKVLDHVVFFSLLGPEVTNFPSRVMQLILSDYDGW